MEWLICLESSLLSIVPEISTQVISINFLAFYFMRQRKAENNVDSFYIFIFCSYQLLYRRVVRALAFANLCRETVLRISSFSLSLPLPFLLLAPQASNEFNVRPQANIMNKKLTFLYINIFRNDLKNNFYRRTRKI